MNKKVLIVGGVAGGASAAARLRRLDEKAEIILFERDEYISFANCGLPYYIGGTIKDREKLIVQTPRAMHERFNIDVRTRSEVVSIDTSKKTVMVKSLGRGEYQESYDCLILSPGAKAIRPDIPGIDSERIYRLRSIPDTDKIKAFLDENRAKTAIVIGGGFIGLEMAENLVKRGLTVTVVEAAPHILAPFDSEMSVIAEKEIAGNGVDLVLNDGVRAFNENDDCIEVELASQRKLKADLVILSIGVQPDTEFLKGSGLQLGMKGHILVNEKMETSVQDVYAVGDAIEVIDFVNKTPASIPLAGPANKQGRIAADNIAGLSSVYNGTQGTAIVRLFDLTAASTGTNERILNKLNIQHKVIFIHPLSHASYYPNALPLTLKLIFNDSGTILGAQAMGYDGVDKRIDVIATVMRLGGTVNDLAELELSYAPPYSSAKDPVNMAGFVAQNVLEGRADVITPDELLSRGSENAMLLDVRTETEFSGGHLDGAVNIPVDNLRGRLQELDKNKEILVYCQVGLRGYIASRILKQNGFNTKNLTGGYKSISMITSIVNPAAQSKNEPGNHDPISADKHLDACGLCCPGPLMQVKSCMDDLKDGQTLEVTASDPGFLEDIKAWCKRTGNELLSAGKSGGIVNAFIKKGGASTIITSAAVRDNKTIVVFSGELDKAIASFIIANGAAAMGKKVTLFFTFWGLNILRRPEKLSLKKNLVSRMFGIMMPRGSRKLKLSKMSMMGMGGAMIRKIMKDNNVDSLEELIQSAIRAGVELVACTMSMELMGIKQEELIDGVKLGGVGYYLGEAEDSNVNLFI
jgi:CoA-disulfide reductase